MKQPLSRPDVRVFSLGYQLRSVEDFVELLTGAGADVVVDVREVPWSRKPGFSKSPLTEALAQAGIAYEHAKFAGNPKSLRKAAPTHEDCLRSYAGYLAERPEIIEELDKVVSGHLTDGKSVCLVCYERHPRDCHRSILLDGWQSLGREAEVVHLAPDGAPRFTALAGSVL